jgi:hypothetical protein
MKHSRISFPSCFSQQILATSVFKTQKVTTADAWNIIFAMDAGDIDE